MRKCLLNRVYSADDLYDIDRDVSECFEYMWNIAPADKEGNPLGTVIVDVTYHFNDIKEAIE